MLLMGCSGSGDRSAFRSRYQLDLSFFNARINARDNTLLTESRSSFADQLGTLHTAGVDADLVGTGAQHERNVRDLINAAAHREWNKQLFSRAADGFEQRAPPLC